MIVPFATTSARCSAIHSARRLLDLVSVPVVELATVVSELSDNWRQVERSPVEVKQIDRSLVGLRIVKSERLTFIAFVPLLAKGVEFFKIRIAVEQLLVVRNSVIFHPIIRAVETVAQHADVSLPVADQEVEVMRSVPLRNGRC
jgi:hypothetical protein